MAVRHEVHDRAGCARTGRCQPKGRGREQLPGLRQTAALAQVRQHDGARRAEFVISPTLGAYTHEATWCKNRLVVQDVNSGNSYPR